MSNRPGLGALALDDIASVLLENNLDELVDVPTSLRHGPRLLPLGRYLRRKLRERIGRAPDTPKEVLDQMAETLRIVRETAHANAPRGFRQTAFKNAVVELGSQKRRQLEHRAKVFKTRKSL